jgi:hypothetical protein
VTKLLRTLYRAIGWLAFAIVALALLALAINAAFTALRSIS